jgi:hypothetical protein
MKTTVRNTIALVLAFSMAFALSACGDGGGSSNTPADPPRTQRPSSSSASDATPAPTPAPIPVSKGDTIDFGGYDWIVLEVSDGKALLLSEKILEYRAYHDEKVDITWAQSDMRAYLNGEFYDSFAASDRARIAETRIVNNDNPSYETPGGDDTNDRIFLLSIEEANTYFDNLSARAAYSAVESPRGVSAGEASWWWLRSPGNISDYAAGIGAGGYVDVNGYNVDNFYGGGGVRPALWLNF